MSRRRAALGGVVVVLVVVLGWVAYQAWQVSRDLSAAASDAEALQTALSNGDDSTVDRRLDALEGSSRSAADRTSGATWSVLTKLPVFGDDARAVRLVSRNLADITSSGLRPLAESATDLESFLPRDGQVPIDALTRLQGPVAEADAAFARADEQLSAEDPTDFVGPLRDRYRELAERVSSASRTLSTADTALKVMPTMLGGDGPRNYLLVFQNNAEVRATGGLPGAVSLMRVEDGRLTLERQGTGGEFGEAPAPVLPLTEPEQQIYGDQLGTYFLDANFTPDFPRAAELMKAHWEQRYGTRIDGVVALDPVTLSYLLDALGTVKVGDVELTSANAVDELLNQVYVRFPAPSDQDAFFEQVSKQVFTKVTAGPGRPRLILDGLSRAASEGRILVHSFDPDEDAVLASTPIDGAFLSGEAAGPDVGVFLNDTTGSKMSYYLRYDASVTSTSCRSGVQSLSGEAHLDSLAPEDAATSLPTYVTGGGRFGIPAGSQLVTLRLYAPVDGTIDSLSINDVPVTDLETVVQDGRQVLTTYLTLEPQRTADLAWTMTGGPGQSGDVGLHVTPGVSPEDLSTVARSAC